MPDNDYRLQLTADLAQMESGLAKITNQLAGVVGGLREMDSGIKRTEAGANSAGQSQTKFSNSLNATRYALYDVSRTMAIAGVALLGFAVLPSKIAISFERDFANVSRTVQGAGADVKNALIGLSTELPTSFKALTEIATLGGQLGIGKSGIIDFTETIAKLTATTNLSAEVAGTALGRFLSFGLVTSDQFENLASAILKVGVNSVATETQIVGIATGVAGIGKVAGLSASTLIGYAGALASVGIQQYAARGTTQRFLSEIQKAATDGGPALQTFAKIAGVSADTLRTSFGTERFSPIFESLISNLGDTSITGQDLNTTLRQLGINSVIDQRTLLQLAAAPKAVQQAFADAASGIKDSSTLNTQYGRIADTTAAKITTLGNSIQAFLASLGGATQGPLTELISNLQVLVIDITTFISSPFGQGVAIFVTAFTALAGILLIVGGLATRTVGSFIGLITAMQGLSGATGINIASLGSLNAALAATGPLGAKAAAGLRLVGAAAKGLLIGTLIIGVSNLAGYFFTLGDNAAAAQINVDKLAKSTSEIDKFVKGANPAKSSFSFTLGKVDDQDFNHVTNAIAQQVTGINGAFTDMGSPLKTIDDILGGLPGHFSGLDQARESVNKMDAALAKLVKGGNAKAASDAMAHILAGAASGQGISTVKLSDFTDQFKEYNKALAESKKASDSATEANRALDASAPVNLVKTLKDLSGLDEKGITKYADAYAKSVSSLTDFNSIVKQVQQTQADSAAAQEKGISLAQYQAEQTKNSAVSLGDFTTQLQSNNEAQKNWAANLAQLSAQAGPAAAAPFIQAGYSAVSNSILQQLVNATPAQRDAYIAAQEEAADLASSAMAQRILASGYLVTAAGSTIGDDTAKALADGIRLGIPVETLMAQLNLRFTANPLTPTANTGPARDAIDHIVTYGNNQSIRIPVDTYGRNMVALAPGTGSKPFASGGHVNGPGTGTSDSINARLSNGEYVIKASVVRAMGVDFFNNLNQGRSTVPGRYADGGPVQATSVGMGVVELGPKSMGVLRKAVASEMSVYLGNEQVARSANRGNAKLNGRGSE